MHGAIHIRDLKSRTELQACVALQKEVWGEQFNEVVPPAILQIVQYVGGIAAGAFDDVDTLLGFVFGVSGVEQTASGTVPVHWSDMLAVRKDLRNRGIGEKLKRYQREVLLLRGVQRIYWSFDPLDCKNAYLNFARLGVIAHEYRVDMYGQTESPLHQGIGTDRLIAVWPITSARVADRLGGLRRPLRASPTVRIDVPLDIHELKAREPSAARQWRERTRSAFTERLEEGYLVVDFERDSTRGSYLLVPASDFEI